MKLANALSLLTDFWFGITIALLPTLKAVLRSPQLLLHPAALSRLYFANVWVVFGDGTDSNAREVKEGLITPYAYGVVLDIGAGHGHTARYLNRARVTRYVALEPNTRMHPRIRAHANDAGFHEADGTLLILACGAQETDTILSSLPPVDTIISVLTLCTIPQPQRTVARLVRDVLRPGGQLLIYEHVLSRRADVAWWQRFWAPVWALGFDGCRLDRPSDVTVGAATLVDDGGREESAWREVRTWSKEGEEEENLFFHSVGRFVRR